MWNEVHLWQIRARLHYKFNKFSCDSASGYMHELDAIYCLTNTQHKVNLTNIYPVRVKFVSKLHLHVRHGNGVNFTFFETPKYWLMNSLYLGQRYNTAITPRFESTCGKWKKLKTNITEPIHAYCSRDRIRLSWARWCRCVSSCNVVIEKRKQYWKPKRKIKENQLPK